MVDVPYQQRQAIEQAEAELANAKAIGNTTRVEAAEKALKNLGQSLGDAAERTPVDKSSDERSRDASIVTKAAAKRAEAKSDEKDEDAKKSEPEGRHAPQQKHTT